MDPFRNPPADTLAAARLHVQALTDCGLPREALLRALLEDYRPSEGDATVALETGFAQQQHQQIQQQQQQQQQHVLPSKVGNAAYNTHNTRLSISTTSSRSSGRASVLSTAASVSSVSSQDIPPPLPPPTPVAATPAVKSNRGTSKPQGAYWCTFCDVAFQRKFDWKRHEEEFHERYKRYPCPNCNRIFWGANSFNQHHKNAHGCTTCPHADSVVRYTQRKQAWACGFCGGFLSSRDRYFDHVARHYEDGCNKAHWNHSLVIYGLLHQPSINHAWKELDAALYGHLPRGQQPMLEWNIEATGHAQGFLEGESPGKLQDLLEFFNDNRDNPRFLARLAHDQAIIRFRNEGSPSPTVAPPSRPFSEPPKPKLKTSKSSLKMSLTSSTTTKHMSAPSKNMLASHNPGNPPQKYNGYPVLKRQRSLAPAPTNFATPHVLPTQPPLDQTALMSPFPQTIVETPETNFFNMPGAQNQTHIGLQQPQVQSLHQQHQHQQHQHQQQQQQHHHQQQQQHHHHHQQHHHHPHQQQQQHQPQHLIIPEPSNIFHDWSSLTTTVVDDTTFSICEDMEWEDLGGSHQP